MLSSAVPSAGSTSQKVEQERCRAVTILRIRPRRCSLAARPVISEPVLRPCILSFLPQHLGQGEEQLLLLWQDAL
eukprot:scaffold713_cov114-Isochrysis_galbana.AAC.7